MSRPNRVFNNICSDDPEFTFWWGSNAVPTAYFDVSIEPNPKVFNIIPLIEEKREITLFNERAC